MVTRVCCILTAACLVAALSASAESAGPVIAFDAKAGGIRPVLKTDLGGKVASTFVVRAKGAAQVAQYYGTISGVLFQATATPEDALRSRPIKLTYKLTGKHDADLHVAIGKHKAVCEAPAWVWAVAARFANHPATGAVTLFDKPQTAAEKAFERRWHAKNRVRQRLLWARYHPAVDDTLMGFFLLAADALAGDPVKMRTITNGLKDFGKYAGFSQTFDAAGSLRAARSLDRIISKSSKPGDCAMLNDVNEKFAFAISAGKLRISGRPHYRFARETKFGGYRSIAELTASCRRNRKLFVETNPVLYHAIDNFSKCVAFFNFLHESEPDKLRAFVITLKPVLDRIPTMTTPIALPFRAR